MKKTAFGTASTTIKSAAASCISRTAHAARIPNHARRNLDFLVSTDGPSPSGAVAFIRHQDAFQVPLLVWRVRVLSARQLSGLLSDRVAQV